MHPVPYLHPTTTKSLYYLTATTSGTLNWFNPLCRLANLPTLRLVTKLSKLSSLSKSSTSHVFRNSYRKSNLRYVPLLLSPLYAHRQKPFVKSTPMWAPTIVPASPWNLWTVRVLSHKTSHALVGHFPRRISRGESTSSFFTPTLDLFRKRRRRRRRWGTPNSATTSVSLLHNFKFYLKSKLQTAEQPDGAFMTRFANLVRLKKVKKLSLRTKKATRFRPYQFLNLNLPWRSFEIHPSPFFNSMLPRFLRSTAKLVSSFNGISHQSQIPRLATSLGRVLLPHSRQPSFFTFTKLPRRLKSRLRWERYSTFVKSRSRRVKAEFRLENFLYRLRQSHYPLPTLTNFTSTATGAGPATASRSARRSHVCKLTGFSTRKWFSFFRPNTSNSSVRLSARSTSQVRFSPHRSILLPLLRRVVNSSRYSMPSTYSTTQTFVRQVASSLLLSPFTANSTRLIIMRTLAKLRWRKSPAPGLRINSKTPLRPYAPSTFSPLTAELVGFQRNVTQARTNLPLYPTKTLVYPNSPLTFHFCIATLGLRINRPLPSNFGLTTPYVHSSVGHSPAFNRLNSFLLHTPSLSTHLNRAFTPLRDAASISPSHSKLFRRSYAFFLNLLVRPATPSLDLIASSSYADPAFSFNVFPDSNLIKVSVFRRLNRQKSLYESRKDLFTSLHQPHLYNPHRVKREETRLNPYPSLRVRSINSPNLSPFYSTSSPYKNPWTLRKPTKQILKVQRVRFKPGYGRIWRRARVSIREILNIPSRYQYRLTPKLQTRYTQDRKIVKSYSSLGLDYLLMSSHLIPDFWVMDSLLEAKSIFLNGSLAQNSRLKVFLNDFIQLTINLKFFITLKWLRNWSDLRQKRVSRVFYSKYRPSGTDKGFKFARPLPNWFFDLRFSYRSIPQILEVDFFTLSIFVIHDKLSSDPTEPVRGNLYEPSDLNMYNWKYIT